jgi:hypothetical protein
MEKTTETTINTKKVAVIIYPGLEYKKAIRYGMETAESYGAGLMLVNVLPDHDDAGWLAMAMCECAPYDTIERSIDDEAHRFFKAVKSYCVEYGIEVETRLNRGTIEEVVAKLGSDADMLKLIVLPTHVGKVDYSVSVEKAEGVLQSVFQGPAKCPVVAVF